MSIVTYGVYQIMLIQVVIALE